MIVFHDLKIVIKHMIVFHDLKIVIKHMIVFHDLKIVIKRMIVCDLIFLRNSKRYKYKSCCLDGYVLKKNYFIK
jgi:hypothetical protein